MVDNDVEGRNLLTFIEAQTKLLKKLAVEELPLIKLERAAAAMADLTDKAPPDPPSAAFLTAWKRALNCHHFWGPTVGDERFCTKCQVPRGSVAPDEEPTPSRRRTSS
jgi:hypothetical protein